MRRAPTSALLASLLMLTAGGTHPTDGQETRPFTEPARTHLLLQAHTPNSADARYLPVLLGDTPVLGKTVAAAALPAYRQGVYYALAAHGGGRTWVTAERQDGGFRVVHRDLDGKILAAAALGEAPPAALHQVGDWVFVGQGNRVREIDFAAEAPELEVARERSDMADKAYDLFIRRGDWLIAIDDVVTPIFADAFRLDGDGLAHVKGFELPGVINGTYGHAALRVDAQGNGKLYAIASYRILAGYGHDLAALPLRGGATQADTAYALQNLKDPTTAVLEEHVPSHPDAGPGRLLAGAPQICPAPLSAPLSHLYLSGSEQEALERHERDEAAPLGVAEILAQHPHAASNRLKRAPAPLVHAASRKMRREFYRMYAAFVGAFYEAVERLKDGIHDPMFLDGAFPPPWPQAAPG